jgi:hypothetical protein
MQLRRLIYIPAPLANCFAIASPRRADPPAEAQGLTFGARMNIRDEFFVL